MGNKLMATGIPVFMLPAAINPAMAATCAVNGKEIPCDIFLAQYGWVFVICFLIPGLLFLIKPDWMLKLQSWSSEKFMGAKYIPSKKTEMIVRIMGVIFTSLSLFFLYLMFS